ncbi:MAG TPA: hypothetical protein VFK32_00875 [Tepidiformaceae bacterium]|nr:hypothetical protein [Tepidiformaceae bacterium]
MLGDKIGQSKGKVTGQRMLPGDDFRFLKMEVSLQETGTLLGLDILEVATFTVFERPGQLYGQGQGYVQAADGSGAIWNGHGVGQMTGEGLAARYRFSVAFQADPSGPFAALNETLVIGEHDVDKDGNTTTELWEWK